MAVSTHPTQKPAWLTRLLHLGYRANMHRTLDQMRLEAGHQYRELVCDLDEPLDPVMEQLIRKSLNDPERLEFRPSHLLLPRMMHQFKTGKALFTNEQLRSMSLRCDQCKKVGECWGALRAKADLQRCQAICPNAEALIAKAS